MDVRTCRGCGRLYNYLGQSTPACPNCMKELEEKFEKCREYIKNNPGANIQKVADETEVTVKMIKQWVREERLEFTEGSTIGIECENCGKSILTGRFCAECKNKLQQNLSNAIKPTRPVIQEEPKKRESARMRFLDN